MKRRRKTLLGLVVVVALLLAGHAYQRAAEARDGNAWPPPGERYDVGGHALHLHCQGTGTPTVVLDAGIGGFSTDWVRVQPQLAGTTRTCAYDRAGYAWSEPAPGPRDLERHADELAALLEAAGEAGPYLLVGHSLGGAVAWRYAQVRSDDVAGVVLVDAPDRAELERSAEGSVARLRTQQVFHTTLHGLATTGLLRLLAAAFGDGIAPETIQYLDEADRPAYVAMMLRREQYRTARREVGATRAGARQLHGAGSLGEVPLVVLTATGAGIDGWSERQEALLDLSSRSEQVRVDASHYVHVERPDAVVEAVGRLLPR